MELGVPLNAAGMTFVDSCSPKLLKVLILGLMRGSTKGPSPCWVGRRNRLLEETNVKMRETTRAPGKSLVVSRFVCAGSRVRCARLAARNTSTKEVRG